MKNIVFLTLLVLSLFVWNGCAKTRVTYCAMDSDFPQYGFWGKYYEQLTQGGDKEHEPAMNYQVPNLKEVMPAFTKVFLDPVVLFRKEKDHSKGINQEDAQTLANYLHNKMYLALKDDIELVDHPAPNILRLSMAITDTERRWVGLDIISTFVPQLRAVSELKGFVTGKLSFVGKAIAEAKLTDAQTGEMLVPAIDRRVGGKSLGKGFSKWADVTETMDYWAEMTKYRFCRLQKRENCVPPEVCRWKSPGRSGP